MKLALGISLIAAFSLVLLYSILVGVMVPGWKSTAGDFLGVLNTRAVAYSASIVPNNTQGWFLARVPFAQGENGTVTIAIPVHDFYGNIEHGVVVTSCAGLGVLAFLVAVLWLSIHFCVNRPLDAKKRGDNSIPYTIFDEAK
jgi:hypothetical protein